MKTLISRLCVILLIIPMTLLAQTPANITFEWDQVISEDFKGWRLYHSYDSNEWIEVATIPYSGTEETVYDYQHRLNDALTNPNHYFMMKAEDNDDNLSGPSNVVLYEYTEDDTIPPDSPTSLNIKIIVIVNTQ